ncbi:MAG: hypothetical protein WCY05_07425 [Candidatus Omnitrophota bacterium]
MKVIPIKDDIYNTNIFIIPDANEADLVSLFKRRYGLNHKYDNDCDGLHLKIVDQTAGKDYHYLIFDKLGNTPKDIGVFNHEMLHLVFSVFSIIGIKYSDDSEEAFAYYLSYLTEKILNKVIR